MSGNAAAVLTKPAFRKPLRFVPRNDGFSVLPHQPE